MLKKRGVGVDSEEALSLQCRNRKLREKHKGCRHTGTHTHARKSDPRAAHRPPVPYEPTQFETS